MSESSLIVEAKLATESLAKDMVNIESAKRVAPGLFSAGKHWLLDLTSNIPSCRSQNKSSSSGDEDQQQQASTEYLVHNWLESLFVWFQVITLWHEPFLSFCVTSGLLTSFLLFTYFAPRFYATISIITFFYVSNKFWFRHVWPDIRVPPSAEREAEMRLDVDRFTYLHPQIMTLDEFGQRTKNLIRLGEYYILELLRIRQERPITFCSLVCSILSCTAYIGNRISGTSLVFWAIFVIMTAPGIYCHLIPEITKEWLKRRSLDILYRVHQLNPQQKSHDSSEEPTNTACSLPLIRKDSKSSETTDTSLTKFRASNLFELFRRKGSDQIDDGIRETLLSNHDSDHKRGLATTVTSPTIEVPRNHDQDRYQASEEIRKRKLFQDLNDEDCTPELASEHVDLRVNNLLDPDEEQHDGFVLL